MTPASLSCNTITGVSQAHWLCYNYLIMFSKYKYHLSVFFAGVCWSTLAIFTQFSVSENISSFNQVFWRLIFGAISSLLMAIFVFKQKSIFLNKKSFIYLLINGVIFFLGFTTFSAAIYLGSPIAKAIALNYSYPIAVVLLSYFVFKHLPSKKNILAIVISLISVALLMELWKVKNISQINIGDVMAWLNSFAFAGIIVWGTKIKKELKLNQFLTLFYSWFFSLLLLIPFSLLMKITNIPIFQYNLSVDFSINLWLLLIGLGTISSTIPLSFMYFGSSKLKPFATSILLLSEVVCVYMAGIFLFGQTLSIWGVLGMIGIMISVLLI